MSSSRVIGLAVAIFAFGCANDPPEETTDEVWSNLEADDRAPAVREEASAAAADPDDGVDDTADPNEPSDADDTLDGAADAKPASLSPLANTTGPTYRNAVLGACADPGVVKLGSTFMVACTGGGFPTFTSPNLVDWKPSAPLFSLKTRPKWASKNFWAPEVHHIGNDLVAYYTAYSPRRGKMCIGAARQVDGVFEDIGRPLVCDASVSLIDSHVFTDSAGKHYLYYKTDGNGATPKQPSIIYGQELGADGRSLVGRRKALIRNRLAWEGDVVEGPWVVAHGSYFYMFYSGFRYCNATYGVGVARAKSPLGAFHKRGAPILRSDKDWTGPGHNSVVDAGGHQYIVYHAYKGAHQCGQDGARSMLVDRIAWQNGWPSVNDGTPSSSSRPVPIVP